MIWHLLLPTFLGMSTAEFSQILSAHLKPLGPKKNIDKHAHLKPLGPKKPIDKHEHQKKTTKTMNLDFIKRLLNLREWMSQTAQVLVRSNFLSESEDSGIPP